jgi:transketolase
VIEIDGHDMAAILDALAGASQVKGQPTIIIAHTTKGKGASLMEDNLHFHGNAPNREEMDQCLRELQTEERCKVCDVRYPGPC